MPITLSAKKALRQSAKRHVFNLSRKNALKNAVKGVKKLAAAGKIKEAQNMLPAAYKAIDKAAKRGVIKPNNAARKKSQLAILINKTG